MKVEFWSIGKTNASYLEEGMSIYEKRIQHYLKLEVLLLPDIKNAKHLKPKQLKEKEGALFLKKIKKGDCIILLDERGKAFTSVAFATFLERQLQHSYSKIIFIVGGAYGFSPAMYERANWQIQLSNMTFSHQMIRLFFLEQFYRAMTILKNEKYHNV